MRGPRVLSFGITSPMAHGVRNFFFKFFKIYLKNFPPPFLVGLISGKVVKVPEALNSFWSQQIVSIIGLKFFEKRRLKCFIEKVQQIFEYYRILKVKM